MYVEWADYVGTFLTGREPSVSEADFPFWERRAASAVDALTFDRLKEPDVFDRHRKSVILCVCELAEYYASDTLQDSAGISSVSVTGHSITFDKTGKEPLDIIRRHLWSTGLLFRGV